MSLDASGSAADAKRLPAPTPVRRTIAGAAADLTPILSPLQRGYFDPTHRRDGSTWWRASTTPDGPVALELRPIGADVHARAWGAGAVWALEQVPRLLGRHDKPHEFTTSHTTIRRLAREHPPRALGATDLLGEAIAPYVIEQKVTGREAFRSIRLLVLKFGTPAPLPALPADHPANGMMCPPSGDKWRMIPSWEFTRAGVDGRRSAIAVRTLQRLGSLQRLIDKTDDNVAATFSTAIRTLPGIGPWTASKIAQTVLGDSDHWSYDDYHVPGQIAMTLVGERLESAAVEELLEEFRPHRFRVEQLCVRYGTPVERRGPRRTLPTHLPDRF